MKILSSRNICLLLIAVDFGFCGSNYRSPTAPAESLVAISRPGVLESGGKKLTRYPSRS